MLQRNLQILLAFLVSVSALAQPEHRYWFFGFGAGLDMSGPTPAVVTGSGMQTDEGVTCISSSAGELLFYTNGERVWDRDHQQMPDGFGLAGNFSSSQSALIVADPEDPLRYFIFTTPGQVAYGGGFDGLAYSVVDMSLNSGKGDVVLKNVELVHPVVEKLSATRHANGTDVWVVAHGWNSNTYFAYLVTCTGIEGPVVSQVGRSMENDANDSRFAAIGCMQFSSQGDRLASVWTQYLPDGSHELRLDVLRFDNTSGVISDPIGDATNTSDPDDARYAYGVCFSPNGHFLYRSEYGLLGGIGYSKIMQYDLEAPDPMTTALEVANGFQAFGSMQKAPDGRIYIARLNGAQYLSYIASPDLPGAQCSFNDAGVSTAPLISTWGLPNHWDTYPPPVAFDPIPFADSTICGNGMIMLDATWPYTFQVPQYTWSTGATTASIEISHSGLYWVEVQLPCTTYTDTVMITIRTMELDLGADLRICEGDSVKMSVPYEEAQWNTGIIGPDITIATEGTYSVEISVDGCMFQDEITVSTRNCRCPFFLPNAFTPNDDGRNDEWSAGYDCEILNFDLRLFDRWGQEIFRTDEPDVAWSGNGLPVGLYSFKLRYSWNDGEVVQHRDRTGHVTLIR